MWKSVNAGILKKITSITTIGISLVRSLTNCFRVVSYSDAIVTGLILFLALLWTPAFGAINVYFSNTAPTSLQATLIADLTSQYNGTFTVSQFQPGSYSFTATSKKTAIILPGIPDNYVYGWRDGSEYQQTNDLGILTRYSIIVDTSTDCSVAFSSAAADIYTQSVSTPPVVPGF